MRRRFALLSLALSAFTFLPATSAHAYPICAGAWVDSPDTGMVGTNYMCIYQYPYGNECQYISYWDDPYKIEGHVWFCYPRVIGTPG